MGKCVEYLSIKDYISISNEFELIGIHNIIYLSKLGQMKDLKFLLSGSNLLIIEHAWIVILSAEVGLGSIAYLKNLYS